MSSVLHRKINRRALLIGSGGFAAAALLPRVARTAMDSVKDLTLTLTAAPGRAPLVGASYPSTDVWCYGNSIPGPEFRVRQGEPVRVVVRNQLSEDTTVHLHGIRLPNAMDGVPGLTQPPIKPGEQFTYEFTPPDAGTFWYHPHADSLQQLGRGMAGALIVEEPEPIAVDRDILWMLGDWRLTSDAQIARGFGNAMEAGMSGRVGNTVTLNGRVSEEEPVRAGERVRLRLVNGALARIMALRFEGHRPVVDFYDGLSYWLTQLAYDKRPPMRAHPLAAPISLPRNPLPEPDLASAERHELRLQGGMMGGGAMMGMGGMQGMSHGMSWAINGHSMSGDGHAGMPPLLTLQHGRSYVLTMRNETAWWHPMHLHGYSFRVLSRNGSPVPHRQWADTVLIPPKESVDVTFVADNPGDWMLHCHVTDHQVSGMMTVLRVA